MSKFMKNIRPFQRPKLSNIPGQCEKLAKNINQIIYLFKSNLIYRILNFIIIRLLIIDMTQIIFVVG